MFQTQGGGISDGSLSLKEVEDVGRVQALPLRWGNKDYSLAFPKPPPSPHPLPPAPESVAIFNGGVPE